MTNRLAQGVSDHLLAQGRNSRAARVLRRVLVERGGDPKVAADVAGSQLLLPLSHELPHYRRNYPSYSENLGVVAAAVAANGGQVMIDVGANVGDSVAIVKAHAPAMKILCIDGDETYLPFLRANTVQWDDVEISAPTLLGERTERSCGTLLRKGGTTHFSSSSSELTNLSALDDIVDAFPAFKDPALIKSDTDGFESSILRGATRVLERSHPALFLEYDPSMLAREGHDGLEMLRWLRSLGYHHIAFYDNFGALLVRTDLDQDALLADLHEYLERSDSIYYYDIVVASQDDRDVIDRL